MYLLHIRSVLAYARAPICSRMGGSALGVSDVICQSGSATSTAPMSMLVHDEGCLRCMQCANLRDRRAGEVEGGPRPFGAFVIFYGG